jgi:hypothetical protein
MSYSICYGCSKTPKTDIHQARGPLFKRELMGGITNEDGDFTNSLSGSTISKWVDS